MTLRDFSKIADAQNFLRKAIDVKDKAVKALPTKRLMAGGLALGAAQSVRSGLNQAREYNAEFYR